MSSVIPYVLIFLAGFAGSLHCVGMCGGFACGLGADPRGRAATLIRHLTYNTGRVMTYCFLGGLFGYFSVHVVHSLEGSSLVLAQRALAGISGALMIFIGLQFLGLLRRSHAGALGMGGQLLSQALRDLVKSPHPGAPLAFGVVNGFLPCPLVYAFVIQAAASGGPLPGFLVMLLFGLGTFPAMLFMGGVGLLFRSRIQQPTIQTVPAGTLKSGSTGTWLSADWRMHGVRLAGAFIVLLGLITAARGVLPLTGHGLHP